MKLLPIIVALLVAALPVQPGACQMNAPGDDTASTAVLHGSHMPGHHAPDRTAGHHCCPASDHESGLSCDGGLHCASCPASMAAVPLRSVCAATPRPAYHRILADGQLTAGHDSPPYRPPTAFS